MPKLSIYKLCLMKNNKHNVMLLLINDKIIYVCEKMSTILFYTAENSS